MPREDLVAALSMGLAPQQQGTADPRWQRLMQQLLGEEERKQAAFDPYQFGAGGQEMDLAQGVTDPNAKFQGGGASGTWQEPPSTLGEWWEQSTAFRPMAEEAVSAATLPGDVYAGRVDPASDEAIDRAAGLAGMVTLGAGAVPAKGAELGMGIRLFHGSPHDFAPEPGHPYGRFRWDKIGTGQGAQSYGVGHYGAEAEGVALDYRNTLSRPAFKTAIPDLDRQLDEAFAQVSQQAAGPVKASDAIDLVEQRLMRSRADALQAGDAEWFERVEGMRDELRHVARNPPEIGSKMYEFEVDAEPEQFLDWDKPLSQQSETAQEALAKVPDKIWRGSSLNDLLGVVNAGYQHLVDDPLLNITGDTIYKELATQKGTKSEATEALRQAGIPGIRYLDQGSRFNPATLPNNPIANEARQFLEASNGDAEAALQAFRASNPTERFAASERDEITKVIEAAGRDVTRNYVIFDDNLINILRKYGMAGMIGTPLGLEMAQRLMQQEQGETAPAL